MNRCVIVGGAPIGDYKRVKSYLGSADTYIYCDCGLKHMEGLGRRPDIIVGDFDSYDREAADKNPVSDIITLNPVKDDTDTSHAVTVGLEKGFEDFLIIGAVGRRIDHSLGNIYLLYRLFSLGKRAMIVDDYSEISIVGENPVSIDDSMPFFSLINITGTAEGIDIENAKYPLKNACIVQTANDLGISNEVLPGEKAILSVRKGCLLLVRDIVG